MLKFIVENHSILADLIAVLAFCLSVFQLVRDWHRHKVNISVELQNFESYHFEKNISYIILLTISNKSDSPISITKILLIDDYGKEFSCCLTHKYVCEHYYNKFAETDIPCTERIFTPDFPLCLPAHGCTMPFIKFEDSSIRFLSETSNKLHIKFITDKKCKHLTLDIPFENKNSLSV